MANVTGLRLPNWLGKETIVSILLIISINSIAYGLFYAPILYADDWSVGIEQVFIKNISWFEPSYRRPLMFIPYLIQARMFGLNVQAQYFTLLFIHGLLAIMVYFITRNIFYTRKNYIGLILSILYLIYPVDYSHMWLTKLHIYLAACLTMLYCYFLLRYAQRGYWLTLVLSILLLVMSFAFYEAQLGLAIMWALIIMIIHPKLHIRKRLSMIIGLTIIIVGFMVLRLLDQFAKVNDPWNSQIDFQPKTLLSNIILGYKINLVWGWTTTI